ncbi:DUF2157 domain-containing protein [Olleya sp. YSTF-M6]|uniref:DUF2157 domain-containing protein n=1 Tax=Olleya sediminilitoris TaxID=2795739 RepID=A0ABS1WPY7_9FLAO|nr:DUF2157 domain-containing protein [Olleya sediminilitoris]MBL7561191.1 DUF2157 domain-containing protein [Olleya sediminilitoris]
MSTKFVNTLPELIQNQIISKDTALRIERYFESKEANTSNKLFVVFGVLGSLLIGSGIILLFAHNWDYLPKMIKTVLAFIPLVIGQLLVGFSIFKKKSQIWKEASGVFLFFGVGAAIALIGQIYNVPGSLKGYLLTWIALCLPLVYLLKSKVLAILHLVFATYYACLVGYFESAQIPWMYLVMLVGLLPFYYNVIKNEVASNGFSLLNWLFPLSLTITFGAFIEVSSSILYLIYILFFGLLYNIGQLPYLKILKLRQNGYLAMGSFGVVVTLLLASFYRYWSGDFNYEYYKVSSFYVPILLIILTVVILVYSYIKDSLKPFNLFRYVFVLYLIIFIVNSYYATVGLVLINFLILGLGIATVKVGVDKSHFGILNYGLLIITALISFRFFDTDMSFVIRGLLFITIGVGFFSTNYFMLKKQKSNHNKSLNN